MADVIDELLERGSVPTEVLAEVLRRESEHGLLGAVSGSKRLAPVASNMRADAMAQAAGIGDARSADALARWKAAMEAASKAEDRRLRAEQGNLNRQNRLDAAGLRNKGMLDAIAARNAAKRGAGGVSPTEIQHQSDVATNVVSLIDDALKKTGAMSAGLAGMTRGIPGMPSHNLDMILEPVRSAIAIDRLEAMRQKAQEMGQKGSGFGQLTEKELSLLINNWRSLVVTQDPDQLKANLQYIRERFVNILRMAAEEAKGGNSAMDDDEVSLEQMLQEGLLDDEDLDPDDGDY